MRSPLGLAGRSIAPRGMREKLALCCGPAERQETWRGSTAGIARGLCGSFVTNFVIRIPIESEARTFPLPRSALWCPRPLSEKSWVSPASANLDEMASTFDFTPETPK